MKKMIFVGLITTLSSSINLYGATSSSNKKPTHDKMVKIVKSDIEIPYVFFEEIHQKIVELCTLLGQAKQFRLDVETKTLSYFCHILLTYPCKNLDLKKLYSKDRIRRQEDQVQQLLLKLLALEKLHDEQDLSKHDIQLRQLMLKLLASGEQDDKLELFLSDISRLAKLYRKQYITIEQLFPAIQDIKVALLLSKMIDYSIIFENTSPKMPNLGMTLIHYSTYFFGDGFEDTNVRLATNVAECIQTILYPVDSDFFWYELIETLETNEEIIIYTPSSEGNYTPSSLLSPLKRGSTRIRSTFSNSPVNSSDSEKELPNKTTTFETMHNDINTEHKIKRLSSAPVTPTIEFGLPLKQHHLDKIERSPHSNDEITHIPKPSCSSPLARISPVSNQKFTEDHQTNATQVTIIEHIREASSEESSSKEKSKHPSPPLKKSSVINPRSLDQVVRKNSATPPPPTNQMMKRLSLHEERRDSSGSPHRPGTPSQELNKDRPPDAPRKMLGNLHISKALQRNMTDLPSQHIRSKTSSPATNSPHTPSPHSQSSTSSLLTSASYSNPFESSKEEEEDGDDDKQSRH